MSDKKSRVEKLEKRTGRKHLPKLIIEKVPSRGEQLESQEWRTYDFEANTVTITDHDPAEAEEEHNEQQG
jgi:hypothetical protein